MIPETMGEWVDHACGRLDPDGCYGAGLVAERMASADLYMAQSEAILALGGTLPDDDRNAWKTALKAVCEELGIRLDKARGALDDVPVWRR